MEINIMVVNTIGHLAEAVWHHPDLSISYAFVIVKLQNHAKGITEKDFLLAQEIERVIQWQPGEEGILMERLRIPDLNILNTTDIFVLKSSLFPST